MKRLLSVFAAFILCLDGICQEPELFDYQAIIHNEAGEVVATRNVLVKISILLGTTEGTVVYSEIHSVITDQHGLVSLLIGNGSDKIGDFVSIDWSSNKYFLKVEIDASGKSVYSDMGTTQILTVQNAISSKASKITLQSITEDKLFISRKYVGKFVDFRQTGPKTYNGPNIVWIKTTMDNTFGKISAYGKKCEFSVGDNLYIKRTYYAPGGVTGYWVYEIENDSSVYYRVSEFQHDRKVLVDTWFK
jgi:hypothetical protein